MESDPPSDDPFVRELGDGVPILLLHGLGGDHRVWTDAFAPLGPGHRIMAPDLRGHGRTSSPPGSTWSFPELAQDVTSLLDARSISRVHLVGLSAGGFLALWLANSAPGRFASLTVIGAAANCDGHTRAVGQRWADTFRTEGYDAYILRLVKDLFHPDWLESHLDFVDAMRARRGEVDPHAVIAWGLAIRSFDLRGRLGKLPVPMLVIHGMNDRVVDPAHGRYLRQTVRGAELRLFRETGHMVPIERPNETAEAIRDWVARHPIAPPTPG